MISLACVCILIGFGIGLWIAKYVYIILNACKLNKELTKLNLLNSIDSAHIAKENKEIS